MTPGAPVTPGRGTIQLNFAKGLNTGRMLPLERRLEMKRAEHKMKMMAEIAKQKRRSTFSQRDGCPLHSWKLTYQAGCWFWVDQVTGAATAAPPPTDQGSMSTSLATSSWARQSNESISNLSLAEETTLQSGDDDEDDSDSDSDGGAKPAVPPCGTGHVVYDSSDYLEFMNLLDNARGGKSHRDDMRPTGTPLTLPEHLR